MFRFYLCPGFKSLLNHTEPSVRTTGPRPRMPVSASVSAVTSAWKMEDAGGEAAHPEWERGERGDKLRKTTKKKTKIEWRCGGRREGKRRLRREMFGKHFITTLSSQLSYLQSNNRGLGSAGQYFIRNGAGERGELGKSWGRRCYLCDSLARSRTPTD